ncbi:MULTISPECIES: ribosome hibernation-promoting factor, HPF/YfiA family [Mesorhizobium]|uniref:Ribosome hibernation promoting factor n=1 Tax=Mesorhizobium australicum TaxID=536018 RepID=A0A1X7NFP5_9HYPH|nr:MULTISPECIES: ribosome-associated translation inhibitor RaiA [Mesorhizobium]MCR5857893.1 ribosome-associated translation inhibitor RaiA [Mesorhizobium sp. J428]SMH35703.1 ribosomal subunit interface protein [Mesorhizobium australicum]
MNLRISGKQMEIGDAFRGRIEERITDAVAKYFDGGFSGHVTVEKQGSRFTADCIVHLDTGLTLQATGQGQDPVPAFEAAAERIEKRLRRYNRRLKSYNSSNSNGNATDMSYRVMEALPDDDEEIPADYAPAIVAESVLSLRSMSVASAVIELDAKDSPVFVFRNSGSDQLNIVYRRPDGNIGWIDPSLQTRGT